MENDSNQKMIAELAHDIMELSRNRLLVDWRFLDSAISKLYVTQGDCTDSFLCDGVTLTYNPKNILKIYKVDQMAPARDFLHSVFHCILRHSFVGEKIDRLRWDTACDIAVENILDELEIGGILPSKKNDHDNILSSLKRKIKFLSAEKIYRYFINNKTSDRDLYSYESVFSCDEHNLWYGNIPEEMAKISTKGWQQKDMSGSNSDSANGMNGESGRSGRSQSGNGDQESPDGKGESSTGSGRPRTSGGENNNKEEWKRIAESLEQDLETFSKNAGSSAGNLIKCLKEVNREKYDYEDFLKKFSIRGEVMKTSEDEFDYVFYTYGLSLYGNLPLIEPLEYSDDKKIRDFVIAIDTSGSCSGELVKHFIEKTYNILRDSENFFRKVNIHIIQCDSKIQHDDVIKSREDFENYIKNVKIYGGGGTDFRPVFQYVKELVDAKAFRNLKGIIYFTDGIGIYPEKKPDYDTAFVFVDDEDRNHIVPPWAMKLVLRKEEIGEEDVF